MEAALEKVAFVLLGYLGTGINKSGPATVAALGLAVHVFGQDGGGLTFVAALTYAALGTTFSLAGEMAEALPDSPGVALVGTLLSALAIDGLALGLAWLGARKGWVFPFAWAAAWSAVGWLSPAGRLVGWMPSGWGDIPWLLDLGGAEGLDFAMGCLALGLASLFSKGIGAPEQVTVTAATSSPLKRAASLRGSRRGTPVPGAVPATPITPKKPLLPLPAVQQTGPIVDSRRVMALAFLFMLLPAHLPGASDHPHPDAPDAPVLYAACVVPGSATPGVEDYVRESDGLASRGAKLIVWPETAVHLATAADHAAFAHTLANLTARRNTYVAATFSTPASLLPSTANPAPKGMLTNVVALYGPDSPAPVFVYSKHALVPVAESAYYAPGKGGLPVAHLFIPIPPSHRRPTVVTGVAKSFNLTLSASICLDAAHPALTIPAASHGAAVLINPASVPSTPLGWDRLNNLRARAREAGLAVLTCDSGPRGGPSALVGSDGRLHAWQAGTATGSLEVALALPAAGSGPGTVYSRFLGPLGTLGVLFAGTFLVGLVMGDVNVLALVGMLPAWCCCYACADPSDASRAPEPLLIDVGDPDPTIGTGAVNSPSAQYKGKASGLPPLLPSSPTRPMRGYGSLSRMPTSVSSDSVDTLGAGTGGARQTPSTSSAGSSSGANGPLPLPDEHVAPAPSRVWRPVGFLAGLVDAVRGGAPGRQAEGGEERRHLLDA